MRQVPNAARGLRLDQVSPALLDEIRTCKRWPIYLWGKTGVGKTFAAAVVYSAWKSTAFWSSMTELCDTLRAYQTQPLQMIETGSGPQEMSAAGYWKKLARVGLVVIDEIGTRSASDHRYDALLRLLDERRNKPLILTGNISPNSSDRDAVHLGTVYDDRIFSRIIAGTLIHMTGHDRRGDGLAGRIKSV
jgi:DNA replication protein DnaC